MAKTRSRKRIARRKSMRGGETPEEAEARIKALVEKRQQEANVAAAKREQERRTANVAAAVRKNPPPHSKVALLPGLPQPLPGLPKTAGRGRRRSRKTRRQSRRIR